MTDYYRPAGSPNYEELTAKAAALYAKDRDMQGEKPFKASVNPHVLTLGIKAYEREQVFERLMREKPLRYVIDNYEPLIDSIAREMYNFNDRTAANRLTDQLCIIKKSSLANSLPAVHENPLTVISGIIAALDKKGKVAKAARLNYEKKSHREFDVDCSSFLKDVEKLKQYIADAYDNTRVRS